MNTLTLTTTKHFEGIYEVHANERCFIINSILASDDWQVSEWREQEYEWILTLGTREECFLAVLQRTTF